MLFGVNPETREIYGPGVGAGSLVTDLISRILNIDHAVLLERLATWWSIYSVIALLFSLLFFAGFIYAKIRYGQLSELQEEALAKESEAWAVRHGIREQKNSRWADVEDHISRDDPSAWRLAIIEADILLEEALTNAGYVGMTIADKLKSANPDVFQSLQDAWDAHKVRNQIAHEGGDFILTKKAAQDTIKKYERVFREFGVV
jgi:hypothetical protein